MGNLFKFIKEKKKNFALKQEVRRLNDQTLSENLKKKINLELTEFKARLKYKQDFIIYDKIYELFDEYLKEVKPEVEKLNGHTHFRQIEIENEIVDLINSNEKVLTFQFSRFSENIGMTASRLGLEKVVLRSLDNEDASIQQNRKGVNIGMMAAIHGLEEATFKSLDNEIASVQQNQQGFNIGMYAALMGMETCVLKSLDNEVSSKQSNSTSWNIGKFSYLNNLEKATEKYEQQYGVISEYSKNFVDARRNFVKSYEPEKIQRLLEDEDIIL